VRKDLSYFGSFGRRGLGYSVPHLREEIGAILGLDRRWRVAVVGAGNIGSALLAYGGFSRQGFDVVAVFDQDQRRVGQRVGELEVMDVDRLAEVAAAKHIEVGVIATPSRAAQGVADTLVAAGVRGILNFAPRKLFVPEDVSLRTVDMTMEFESLSFALTQARTPRRRRTPRDPA
jgi:redox-sensing transcriptional repressor